VIAAAAAVHWHTMADQITAAIIDVWLWACLLAVAVGIVRWGFRGRR
jgi:hypothetical protein